MNNVIYLKPVERPRIVYVNRAAVVSGVDEGSPAAVWVVEEEESDGTHTYICFEFYATDVAHAAPQMIPGMGGHVSVVLEFTGRMLLRMTPDPQDPDWLTAVNFLDF